MADAPPVDLMKIDIEGAELRALHGMEQRLGRDRPALIMEINLDCLAREGTSPDEVIGFLRQHGYAVYLLPSVYHGAPDRVDSPYADHTSQPYDDILCLREDRAEAVVRALVAGSSR